MSAGTAGISIRVVALHWDDICAPWRLFTPLAALSKFGYRTRMARLDRVRELPSDTDLLIMHCPAGAAALRLIEAAHRRDVPVIVDVDDLFQPGFLRSCWVAEERDSIGDMCWAVDPAAARARIGARFRRCLAAADAVTVSTEPLAEAYRPYNPAVYVLPNCYDDANPLWDQAPPQRRAVQIGFAGMNSHRANLALLRGALEPVLRAHRDVHVVEAGVPELGAELLPQLDAPAEQLVHLGTVPFAVYPLLLRQMDIVLAPLLDEPFTRCKSNIRCMTAGLVGAPVVASPVGAYAEYVQHGVNGFHARGPDEWAGYLEQLVSDPRLRRAMGAANRRAAVTYAISAHLVRWAEVYERVLRRRRCA